MTMFTYGIWPPSVLLTTKGKRGKRRRWREEEEEGRGGMMDKSEIEG